MFRKGIADKIVVLGKGKIVEMGTYENLIAQKGEFTRLWKLYHNIPEEKFVQELTAP
jgi:ABC-type multidrug transport system fused ATPase/permease subunit